MLANVDNYKEAAKEVARFANIFYLGRGIHSPIAAE
jgi:glucosamine 6-phosphate synthetase-like amidotransferase/phosphosugar isomerase protein